MNERPDGLACTVTEMLPGVKFANSVMGPFIVIVGDALPPEYDPVPLPVQLLKL